MDERQRIFRSRLGGGTPPSNISCEGATDSIYFSEFEGGGWDIEIDGNFHDTGNANLGFYIRQNFSSFLDAADDGDLGIFNIDEIPHRIRLIPKDEAPYYVADTVNPTLMQHEDGSLSFCLAPEEIEQPTCTPSLIPMLEDVMGVNTYIAKWSINGGEIKSHSEPCGMDTKIQKVLVNLLGYYGFFAGFVTNNPNGATSHFLTSYVHPIQGAQAGQGLPMTIELYATPDVNNCLITKAFGGDFVLHSCGQISWNESTVRYPE